MQTVSRNYRLLFVFIALSFVLYGNSITGQFVLDDISVVQNPTIQNISGAIKAFTSPYYYARPQSGLYRPLTLASFAISNYLSDKPAISHVVNILLHALICFLVFILVLTLKDTLTAWLSSLIFMFLPIHVESVASIVGRAELLALLFSLMALLASLKNKYWLSSLWFLLALFSKEISIAFLSIWAYVEFVYKRQIIQIIISKFVIFIPAIIVYSILRYIALGRKYFLNAGGYSFFNPIRDADFFQGLWTALKVLSIYVQKIIFPTYFSSDYSYSQIPLVNNFGNSWQTWLGMIILGGLIYLSFRYWHNIIGLGCIIFLSSYFIVSNLVFKIGTIMAERLMYLPSLGFAVIAGEIFSVGFSRFKKYKKVLIGALVMLLAAYGVQAVKGNRLWSDEKTLFENAYKYGPNSVVNMTNMASILSRSGKQEGALEKIENALALEPKNAPALYLRGQIKMLIEKPSEAEQSWRDAIKAQSDYLYPYISLSLLYYKNGDFKNGESILESAPAEQPLASIGALLALNKIGLGKNEEVISSIESVFGKTPKEEELQFILGIAYLKKGDESSAWKLLYNFKTPGASEKDYLDTIKKTKIF